MADTRGRRPGEGAANARGPALRAIVESHRQLVASVCHRYLRGADVDDAIQETFIRLLNVGSGQPIESLPAWLSRVATTVCLDALRRRGADGRRVEGASIAAPRRAAADPSAARRHAAIEARLAKAMGRLPESEQRLIAERFVGDVPLRVIAARTGESVATVSRRCARAIATLAGLLRELGVVDGDEHLLAEHFADPAYAASRDASEPDSPLRVARTRRAMERAAGATFALADASSPAVVGPLLPGWTRPVRVGAVVSHASILAVGYRGARVNASIQVEATGLLADPRFELVAVVEPRTTHHASIERKIRDYGLLGGLIEATDVAGLASLDVLLFGCNFVVTPAVVRAVRAAVGDHGVGLMKDGWLAATHLPHLPPEAGDLMLAGSPVRARHMPGRCWQTADAVVCRPEPLLGHVPVGSRFRVGGCGPAYLPAPGATMVARRVATMSAAEHGIPGVGTIPLPLYLTGTIGRGRAIVINDATLSLVRKGSLLPRDYFPNAIAWLAEPRRESMTF